MRCGVRLGGDFEETFGAFGDRARVVRAQKRPELSAELARNEVISALPFLDKEAPWNCSPSGHSLCSVRGFNAEEGEAVLLGDIDLDLSLNFGPGFNFLSQDSEAQHAKACCSFSYFDAFLLESNEVNELVGLFASSFRNSAKRGFAYSLMNFED